MKQQYLETGKVVGTHGIAGELRVQPWCDTPTFLTRFKTLYTDRAGTAVSVLSARVHGNIVLLKLAGVTTIEQAERLRGAVLYIDRADVRLPAGGWFVQDLLGCVVYDADTGAVLGTLKEVSKTGANDVWHVCNDRGEFLVPAIPDVIVEVDIDAQRVTLRPIKGIFDDAH